MIWTLSCEIVPCCLELDGLLRVLQGLACRLLSSSAAATQAASFCGGADSPAKAVTHSSGIGALLPGAAIDDFVFEPCGYSMNGLQGAAASSIHVTPEEGWSYASFELSGPCLPDVAALAGQVMTLSCRLLAAQTVSGGTLCQTVCRLHTRCCTAFAALCSACVPLHWCQFLCVCSTMPPQQSLRKCVILAAALTAMAHCSLLTGS